MGIDKPNIRYIVHFGFPGALEAYFQQIGRAGRDREHSHCILLWDGPTRECKQYLETLAE
jgi:ATP-dependent DNA helicase RecQ